MDFQARRPTNEQEREALGAEDLKSPAGAVEPKK